MYLFFFTVAPEKASLSTNVSTVPVICAGMVVKFTCTVEANPKVDTFALYENGRMISDKTDTGVWITTLGTGGEVTYKCEANNSIGTGSSENISFTIEGEATNKDLVNFKRLSITSFVFDGKKLM